MEGEWDPGYGICGVVRSSIHLLKVLSFTSLSLLSVDEKAKSYPPDFSPSVGSEGGPPAYAAETNQPAGIVYVQAAREVRLRSHFGREALMHVAYNYVYILFILSCL